jgi:hypothetical protein
MKFFAGILISYLFVIMAMPFIPALSCEKTETSICENICSTSENDCFSNENDCSASESDCSTGENDCSDPCNEEPLSKGCCPYSICFNICLLGNITQNNFAFSDVLTDVKQMRLMNENVASNYLSDCWHPPEIV